MYFTVNKHVLNISKQGFKFTFFNNIRNCSSGKIKIGNISKTIFPAKHVELVPTQYLSQELSQNLIGHIQWIMKKDLLGQDIFLIGLPGPLRARLIMKYLELTQREVEYVVLSRDSTESDLKQRREIKNGTAHYEDQSAVKAAIEGRFLVLDGIEKAERNVLPVLNNLLENREMQLEDGRFLISSARYDKLLKENSQEVLDKWNLVRVSENFRVVALGLPVPHFKGNPLDPPFRSRFQARHVQSILEDQLSDFSELAPHVDKKHLKNLLSACHAFMTNESATLGIPKFPIENLFSTVKILNNIPNTSLEHIFSWMYPYKLFLQVEAQKSVIQLLKTFGVYPKKHQLQFNVYENSESNESHTHCLEFMYKNTTHQIQVLGHKNETELSPSCDFVSNDYHHSILADMLQTHTAHDFCLVGNKGSGKTILVKKFASMLNYPIEMIMLYKDMTARDLLQQRTTDEAGNTSWRPSQLVKAAQAGKLLILDGLHRLHSSTLTVLQRLVHDRDIQLYDNTRLLRHDRYDSIKQKLALSDDDMTKKKILRIHPSFRIIALAETPKIGASKDQWITPESMSLFLFHSIRPLSLEEERLVIECLVGPTNEKLEMVLKLAHYLRNSEDEALRSLSASFSSRQLIRIARRLASFPHESIYTLVTQACLEKFLPQLTRDAMENALEHCGILYENVNDTKKDCLVKDNKICIGSTTTDISNPGSSKVKVPEIVFYDNNEHIAIMEAMLQDFILGEHLLLVGNQGVGKNKVTDRFLQLLNKPREYVQLHRDTTVQSLTQQPSVVDGRIIYEDSPLLKAVQAGHVLVIDEADKAPTHVTSILKALVESGEMTLSDGRSIIHHTDRRAAQIANNIVMHPDFRMIVLANRPGFPFLGNDFFATLGDIFSCHAVDNPSVESEIAMLRQYGPNVPEYLLIKLVKLFGDLRSMSDKGLITYPYSTREVVNIVKHLNQFENESMTHVLKNVFDFDTFTLEMKETLSNLFNKHGIPFDGQSSSVKLAQEYNLPKPILKQSWNINKSSENLRVNVQNLYLMDTVKLPISHQPLDIVEARSDTFSEEQRYWQLPLSQNDIPLDMVSTVENKTNDLVFVVTANPLSLFTMDPNKAVVHQIDISHYFPPVRTGFQPKIKMHALSSDFHGFVFLHEQSTNQSFIINPLEGLVSKINLSSILEDTLAKISRAVYANKDAKELVLCSDSVLKNKCILYYKNGSKLYVLDFENNKMYSSEVTEIINHVSALDQENLLLIGKNNNLSINITGQNQYHMKTFSIKEFNESNHPLIEAKTFQTESVLSEILHCDENSQSTLILNSQDYASVTVKASENDHAFSVFSFPRIKSINSFLNGSCILPQSSQIIRVLSLDDLPQEARSTLGTSTASLEVVDLKNLSYCYIPVNLPFGMSSYVSWLAGASNSYLLLSSTTSERLLSIDASGCIRTWETSKVLLKHSIDEWRKLFGAREEQLTIEHENMKEAKGPKHGKVDSKGAPHVGGNTWAGGTGGRDTAGLGGKGGPYRLDAGHTVHQLSDAEKQAVSLDVQNAAREMARKAYKDKLREIKMSEYDAELYESFYNNVQKQVKTLRVIIDGLQAKSEDRQWMKHQTSGELDDGKLIEGITGEKSIYKRRGLQEPEMGSPLQKPKRLRIVVDVSGSMYRFNGHDDRLQRELESIVLVMEAFDGYQDKFQYEIIGHSGDEFCLEFSKFGIPPKNNKERLDIIKNMYVHSQYCMSGDNTLPATKHAIKTITDTDADEYFVIVMSDANFDRYGISPQSFGKLLTSDPKVNAFAIFIGSLGDQASILSKQIPAGRGFICFDTTDLTQILQRIFTSTLLRG